MLSVREIDRLGGAKISAVGGEAPVCAWYPVVEARKRSGDETLLFGRRIVIASRGKGEAPRITDAETGAALAARAHGGLIWACADPANVAQAPPILEIGRFADRAPSVLNVKLVHASYDQAVLGLVDAAHVPVVHSSWWWRKRDQPRKLKTKYYSPSPYGFTAKAHNARESAAYYKLLGDDLSVTIDFNLPGYRIERQQSRRFAMFNATTVTPLGPRLCALTNLMYSDALPLRLASPFMRVVGDVFLGQDARVLSLTRDHLPGAGAMLFVGEPDEPSKWYFALKRELKRAQEEARAFVNPVTAAVLRWRT